MTIPPNPHPEQVEQTVLLNTDEARLALFQAINAVTIGNKTDDKLIIANLAKQGVYLASLAKPHPEQVKARVDVARIIALHGLGTTSGDHREMPTNGRWTQEEWERCILECIPECVEQQCYELADAILASLANRPADDGEFVPDEREKAAIGRLCAEQDLSPRALIRQALRLYESDHARRKAGETVTWSGDYQRLLDFAGPLASPDHPLMLRAYEVVHHDEGCPSIGGAGDKDCRCDAVPFLRDLRITLGAALSQPEGVKRP